MQPQIAVRREPRAEKPPHTWVTNTSLRERPKMPRKQRSMVSALIQEAVDKGLVRSADPENKSKKFAEYVPFWA